MTNDQFYKEATEWAASLDFSEHYRSADLSHVSFISNNPSEITPSLECYNRANGEPYCKVKEVLWRLRCYSP